MNSTSTCTACRSLAPTSWSCSILRVKPGAWANNAAAAVSEAAMPATMSARLLFIVYSLERVLSRNRLEQLEHRLVGPVVRIFVDLGVAASLRRLVDVLSLAEAVPELLHFVCAHVVGAPLRRLCHGLSPEHPEAERERRRQQHGEARDRGNAAALGDVELGLALVALRAFPDRLAEHEVLGEHEERSEPKTPKRTL